MFGSVFRRHGAKLAFGLGMGTAAWSATTAFADTSARNPATAALRKEIVEIMEAQEPFMGPELVRLAWHASGTYNKKTGEGGNHGTMDKKPEATDGANAGLGKARGLLAPLEAKYNISKADLWCLASLIAIDEMGGPKIPFSFGREDGKACPPTGRLPDATQGQNHLRKVFGGMGFDDQEIVALSGAHALGRCNKDRSGFEGPWTNDPYGFSNGYFVELLTKSWDIKESSRGTPNEQYEDVETRKLMMLPSDMALLHDPIFRNWVQKYADDNDLFCEHFSRAYAKLMNLSWDGKLAGPGDY